jgi:AraC family transcriptional regulator, transcriptional activator of pobA
MENKNVRQVSEFNNELKLKGFNVFQIEADGNATKIIAERTSIKYA